MPVKKITTKKARRSTAKRPAKRAVKKRTVRKSTSRVKKAVVVQEEPETPVEILMADTQLPKEPKPEPIAQQPMMQESDDNADEVEPIVAEPRFSTLSSRISFYLGVVTGAAVLHVLVFALVAIVNS